MKKYLILMFLLIPVISYSQFKGRWKTGANAPTASHTTTKTDTLDELTSGHGIIIKASMTLLTNLTFTLSTGDSLNIDGNEIIWSPTNDKLDVDGTVEADQVDVTNETDTYFRMMLVHREQYF